MHDIKITAKSVFIEGYGMETIEVSLHYVDLADMISEVGAEQFLAEMDIRTIEDYLDERKAEEAEDDD